MKKKKPGNKLNEPLAPYPESNFRIFHSFEEAKEFEIKSILLQSPVQRIKDTVELILRIYGFSREELNKRSPLKNIKLIHYK